MTLRQHYKQAEATSGTIIPAIHEVPPEGFDYVWRIFMDLAAQRPSGFGSSPIPISEMQAYQFMTGRVLSPFMVECIRVADQALLKAVADKGDS